jgi:phosphohistidine phosphatase
MKLYLVRHGIAVDRGTSGLSDEERFLTEEGIEKMRQAARGLGKIGVRPALILSSPLVRARQTAEILAEALGKNIPVKLTAALSPAGTREQVYEDIRRERRLESVMLVGHQPSLGELAGALAWRSPDCYVELKKGGACAIELDQLAPEPRGKLLLLLTPPVMRSLAP